jgi:hypothetical protein
LNAAYGYITYLQTIKNWDGEKSKPY